MPFVAPPTPFRFLLESFWDELIDLAGVRFPNADVSVSRLFRVDFLVGSALSAGCCCGVVFVYCRFEEVTVFFEAADDYPSLDATSVPLRSTFFSVMPPTTLEFVFPPVLFPVCSFALRFSSVASASFLSCFCSFRDIFFGRPVSSSSRPPKTFHVELQFVVRYLKIVSIVSFS